MNRTPFTTLNFGGKLLELNEPMVLGILNVTPDSFYAESRKLTERNVIEAAGKMLGTASAPLARWQERGVDWIAMGSDWGFMAQGFRNMLKERDEK